MTSTRRAMPTFDVMHHRKCNKNAKSNNNHIFIKYNKLLRLINVIIYPTVNVIHFNVECNKLTNRK